MNNVIHGLESQEHLATSLLAVIEAMAVSIIDIAERVRLGALSGVLGSTTQENVQGETQKKLDLIANDIIKHQLRHCPAVMAIASEEEETSLALHPQGEYLVAFDPLDGSSNIDVNAQIGTIFSILPAQVSLPFDRDEQFLQAGTRQLCAGYALYGPSTLLVLCLGGRVSVFTLDVAARCFVMTQAQLSVPRATQEFSVNMANLRFWAAPFKRYIDDLLAGECGPRGKRYNMRWNGAMVGDVHRVLMRGGIFLYPSDSRNPAQPAKLRLLYEANPLALLVESAGGETFDEVGAILNKVPVELHQRVPVMMGSADEMEACIDYFSADQSAMTAG